MDGETITRGWSGPEAIPHINADGYDHAHGFVRVRFGPFPKVGAAVYLILERLHIRRDWMIESGPLPHDPECTPAVGVTQ